MYDEITFFTTTSAFSRKVHTELVSISRKFPVGVFADCYLSGNYAMKTLSLESVLLYQLGSVLLSDLSDLKADEICFFDFLHAVSKENIFTCSASNQKIADWCKIPLRKKQQKSKNTSQILYVSALPQAISALGRVEAGQNPSVLSQVIVNRLNQSRFYLKKKLTNERALCSSYSLSIEAQLWLEFEIETQKSGWITFCLSHQGLGQWLRHLQPRLQADTLSESVNSPTDDLASNALASDITRLEQFSKREALLSPPRQYPTERNATQERAQKEAVDRLLWQAQYTYACCARIEREYVAKANAERFARQKDVGYLFEQIPCEYWQNEYALSPPAVHSLVYALVDMSDSLFWIPYRWPTQQYLLLLERAKLLCQAFEQFYRVCLCGLQHPYVASKVPAIAHKLLSQILVKATKSMLECLLQEHLGEKAPEHL